MGDAFAKTVLVLFAIGWVATLGDTGLYHMNRPRRRQSFFAGTGTDSISNEGHPIIRGVTAAHVRHVTPVSHIVYIGQGVNVPRSRFPYVCLLTSETVDNKVCECTGVVIRRRWLITAAHCLTCNGSQLVDQSPEVHCNANDRQRLHLVRVSAHVAK